MLEFEKGSADAARARSAELESQVSMLSMSLATEKTAAEEARTRATRLEDEMRRNADELGRTKAEFTTLKSLIGEKDRMYAELEAKKKGVDESLAATEKVSAARRPSRSPIWPTIAPPTGRMM